MPTSSHLFVRKQHFTKNNTSMASIYSGYQALAFHVDIGV
jgi:hypothetical protein